MDIMRTCMQDNACDEDMLFNIIEELDIIAKDHNATVPQAALNYLLQKPAMASLIIGVKTAEQLEANLKTTDWEMTLEEVARLDRISEPLQDYPYYTWDPEKQAYIKH